MILDLDQRDIDRIAEAVAERISQPQGGPWLTRSEAAEHLRCSTKQLDTYVRLGDVPVYRPSGRGGRPLFSATDLDAFVADRRE